MTLEELLAAIDATGVGQDARLVVEDAYGKWVPINLVGVEGGSDPFVRFFRDDDIPAHLGAPGCPIPAGSIENAATRHEAEDIPTMCARWPWNYECKMSPPGAYCFHLVEFSHVDSADGFDVVVLKDGGEAHDYVPLLF